MNPIFQIILVGSNLALAAAVSYHVLKPGGSQMSRNSVAAGEVSVSVPGGGDLSSSPSVQSVDSRVPDVAAAPIQVDFQPLTEPLESLNRSIDDLNLTVQRLNTTALQYAYLQKEIERTGNLEQALQERIRVERARSAKNKTADSEKALAELVKLQSQIQQDLKGRRATILKIIEGLENRLTGAPSAPAGVPSPPKNPVPAAEKGKVAPASSRTPAGKPAPR